MRKWVYSVVILILMFAWVHPVWSEHSFYDHFGSRYGYSYGYSKDRDGYQLGYSHGYSYGYPGSHFGYTLSPYDSEGARFDIKPTEYGHTDSDYRFSHGYPLSPDEFPPFEVQKENISSIGYDPVLVSTPEE